jgi:LPS-assembly protein
MRPRYLVFITLLALCHAIVRGQALTDPAPPFSEHDSAVTAGAATGMQLSQSDLPNDPGQEILPVATPEPAPPTGTPVEWQAQRQQWEGDIVTLTGNVEFHYLDYVLRADKVTYNRKTTEMEAEGHLQLAGGPNDVLINASHGDMRLSMHTARFYDVNGSQGIRSSGRTAIYTTTNPLLFSARVAIQTGEGNYQLVDGTMTNCRLPHPDWSIVAKTIALENGTASTSNSFFKLLGVPIFYLPYLQHAVTEGNRESGFLIPVVSFGSSIRGTTLGEQVYLVINRSMDMVIGTDYFSRRGWAPNGDFRYRGPGLDHVLVRWNSLLDRGVEQPTASGGMQLVNQGGVDIAATGSKDFSEYTRLAGTAEYLSSYVYRLVFDDNYAQATSSEVKSNVALVNTRNGLVPSAAVARFQTFASTAVGNEVRILHLPSIRYDVLDRPLRGSRFYWGLGSSLNYLSRSEPNFHARNVGRFDVYPHLMLPVSLDGWTFTLEGALRNTSYTISQTPSFVPGTPNTPTISHEPLNRMSGEASVDIRPPAVQRDFEIGDRFLRHVIEPELSYHFVGGIGRKERNVLLFDTTDILTDTNEVEYSLTQRFYLRRKQPRLCATEDTHCEPDARQWASWQIAQKAFIDDRFGGAVIRGRRNVFDTTLDLSAVAFLTAPRSISPVISRMRFEAIDNLRIEWDLDYDSKHGMLTSNNLFAGYSFGRTTVGVGHALLNAVDENTGTSDRTLKSQLVTPFIEIGKPAGPGLNVAVHGGYDFDQNQLQYAGVQLAYNWDCCGMTVGYRRFVLGTGSNELRDETQWLYSFTLANFGNVGDIRRSNAVFRDPAQPPLY